MSVIDWTRHCARPYQSVPSIPNSTSKLWMEPPCFGCFLRAGGELVPAVTCSSCSSVSAASVFGSGVAFCCVGFVSRCMALPIVPLDPELSVKAPDRATRLRLFFESWRRVGAAGNVLKLFIRERVWFRFRCCVVVCWFVFVLHGAYQSCPSIPKSASKLWMEPLGFGCFLRTGGELVPPATCSSCSSESAASEFGSGVAFCV